MLYNDKPDGNVHIIPEQANITHFENKGCWCCPEKIQSKDNENDKEVWQHKGYEQVEN